MKDGHLSKGMSPQDIANKHKVNIDAIKRQLKMGIKVEKEHTSNLKAATRIALDHLYEDPKYYSKLSKIRLEEIKYTEPNFDAEWDEAQRYPEFKDMGKQEWIKWASQGYTTKYSKIKNVLSNVDLNFKDLDKNKKDRFETAFQNGTIETPIAVKFDDTDYDLVAGNTRLSGLVKNNIDPEIWVVDLTQPLNENQNINSEITKIGTLDQYIQYLNSIFPNSKIKSIVYHGTFLKDLIKDKFKGYVTYFSTSKKYSDKFSFGKDENVIKAVVNVQNPYIAPSEIADVPEEVHDTDEFTAPRIVKSRNLGYDSVIGVDAGQKEGKTIVIFNPEQIHILGSKQDIEGFKQYVKKKSLNENQLSKILVSEFMKACMTELELDKLPKITFSNNSKEAMDMRSWGGYQPGTKSIYIVTAKRHPADIFRTLAHELVHYKQDLEGRLEPDSGKTGSEDENEANSKAAVIMRNFAQAKPNLFEHLITEIGEDLSSAYPFQYVGGENSKYTFKTDNFDYDVLFTLQEGDYDLAYDSPDDDGNYELIYKIKNKNIGELPLTGEGKAIKVNATVTAILLDFIKKNPNFISIMISPINQQRYNLLKKFIDNNLPSNYDVKGNGTLMLITHKK